MPVTSHVVDAKRSWSGQIKKGQFLTIKDTHGQQAVDFLCYDNFSREISKYNMGLESIVPNINWFMSVPVLDDGSAGVSEVELRPGSYIKLRADCNVLAVLSNCPQMQNACNGFNPTPIEVSIQK